jgi:hypothetical protein
MASDRNRGLFPDLSCHWTPVHTSIPEKETNIWNIPINFITLHQENKTTAKLRKKLLLLTTL